MTGFNLCLPMFLHHRVEPHGGLSVLDLGDSGTTGVHKNKIKGVLGLFAVV